MSGASLPTRHRPKYYIADRRLNPRLVGQVFRRDIDHLLEDWLNVLIPDEWGKSSDDE